jgi:predicted Zn finger-like uncharacterized protein
MDVRCEKCQTEYELDESRLKPGGVTVKCTQCGHMFKIRRAGGATGGHLAAGNGSLDPDRTRQITGGRAPSSTGVPRAATSDFGSGPSAERMWIIRLDSGESRTCRELGTLQQWILSGLVTRESLISRTGKTWKRLGDIAELASFFQVADEARFQRAGRDSARITATPPVAGAPAVSTQLGRAPSVGAAAAAPSATPPRSSAQAPTAPRKTLVGTAMAGARDRDEVTQPRAVSPAPDRATVPLPTRPPPQPPSAAPPSLLATPPGATVAARPSTPPPALPSARPGATPAPSRSDAAPVPSLPRVAVPVPPSQPGASLPSSSLPSSSLPSSSLPPEVAPGPSGPVGGIAAVSERSTGAWASADVKPMADSTGPVGPIGGQLRGVAAEPAFANSGRIPPAPPSSAELGADFGGDFGAVPGAFVGEETSPVLPPRRGVGRWIVAGSLLVIAIAGAVVYTTVFRSRPAVIASIDAGLDGDGGLDGDAGAIVETITDAPAAGPSDAVVAAQAAMLADSGPGLVAAAQALAADPSPLALATHARLLTAIAQSLEDEAALVPTSDKKRAEQLRRDARQRLLEAVKPAQRAIAASQNGADLPLSHIAMADLLRQQGKPAADVKRHLDRARALAPDDRELRLASALLALREGKTDEARSALVALDRGPGALEQSGDVRARFRLAVIAQAAGDAATARTAAESVVAVADGHTAARALLARLGEGAADPLPPEEPTPSGAPTPPPSGAPSPSGSPTPAPSGDSGGDSYDRVLAQANKLAEVDCGKAMPLFEKAIDLRPSGVEALSGAGYCHVDNKEFASAHAKFRAALAVSPRFERALWGIAEAYQQQGRADLAIEAYRRYLEVYPDSAQAKRQLDKLGGGAPAPGEPKPEPTAPAPSAPAEGGGAAEPSPSPGGGAEGP